MSDDAPRGNPGVDPDDLDISKSEYVRELGDDRYVVSPRRRQPQRPPEEGRRGESPDDAGGDADADAADDPDIASTAESVRQGLSPDDGPGAVDAPTDAAQSPPSSPSGSPPADSSPSPSPADGRARRSADSADSPDSTTSTGSPDQTGSADTVVDPARRSDGPAGDADGLPADPTADDRPPADDRVEPGGESGVESGSRDRPVSHARRGAPRGGTAASSSDLDAGAVGEWLAASLADTEFAYGFDATLSLDGRTARHRMASDDVGETFETLITWFADAAGGDTDAEDALGILLAGMDTAPRLPPDAVRSALAGLGVSRGDSVEDVLTALEEAGGLRLK